MKWFKLCWASVILVVFLESIQIDGAPTTHDEDMLKTLMELDRRYSLIARPSLRSGSPFAARPSFMEPKVQRAINMLRLQNLDKMYAEKSRPRFGKRDDDNFNYEGVDYTGQDYDLKDSINGWIPIRR